MAAKRGRPHKLNPQIIAGWRYLKDASIAETAKRFGVSLDTVKRACRDHGDGALLARRDWSERRWLDMADKLEFLVEKRGGYLPVFRGLTKAMSALEEHCREAEAAMTRMGTPFVPSRIVTPKTERELEVEKMRAIFEWGLPDDDAADEWDFNTFHSGEAGW